LGDQLVQMHEVRDVAVRFLFGAAGHGARYIDDPVRLQ
jgi:hypothetical protein